jgi:hypothetical protein
MRVCPKVVDGTMLRWVIFCKTQRALGFEICFFATSSKVKSNVTEGESDNTNKLWTHLKMLE